MNDLNKTLRMAVFGTFRFYRNFINRFRNNRIRKLMHTSDEGFDL